MGPALVAPPAAGAPEGLGVCGSDGAFQRLSWAPAAPRPSPRAHWALWAPQGHLATPTFACGQRGPKRHLGRGPLLWAKV